LDAGKDKMAAGAGGRPWRRFMAESYSHTLLPAIRTLKAQRFLFDILLDNSIQAKLNPRSVLC
jgi:hypothetical protein